MTTSRLLALATTGILVSLLATNAQPNPAGKLPQVKPGDPSKLPQVKPGDPKQPMNPGKNPMNPGMNPPIGLPGVGQPPVVLPIAGQPTSPSPKKDAGDWPKEIGGKKITHYVREMREASDPAVREASIRVLPQFGPDAQDAASKPLMQALTRDTDINVRLAALSVVPLLGFDEPDVAEGMTAVFALLGHPSPQIRFEACMVLAAIGPYDLARKNAMSKLAIASNDVASWRVRQAANLAMGSVGRGQTNPDNPDQRIHPDTVAVENLLRNLRADPSAPVRREAANALIGVGPVNPTQVKTWRPALESVIKAEKDKSVVLWARVALLKNDPLGIKANEAHLSAINAVLNGEEAGGRVEACQALGVLGELVRFKVKDLLDVATNPKEENEVVLAAIQALSAMKSQAAIAIPVLQKVKESHKNEDIRKVAGDVLDYLDGKKAVAPMPMPKKN